MASQPESSASVVFTLSPRPGVRRDGTRFDSNNYSDAVWTRFQRGRPRKIGGYRLMSDIVSGPVRDVYIHAASVGNTAHTFSGSGIEVVSFDEFGDGSGIVVRTPTAYVRNDNNLWQTAAMYSSGGGGQEVLIAAATPDALNIASEVNGKLYSADLAGTGLFTAIQDGAGDIAVSGGCCVLQPFLFVYGNNGLIKNCDANDFTVAGWAPGAGSFANEANVAGTKVVKGLPMRGGGQAPAGLFWTLESLVRVTFVNSGSVIWNYDTVSASISILAKNSVVEYAGVYYWPGQDRFFAYNGVVQEVPNTENVNFFYDNVNPIHRNKVWAAKVPRFGEIWWFFPFGDSTECNHALIFNVREGAWYDTPISRSAGASPQEFRRPIFAGGDLRTTSLLTLSGVTGAFDAGTTVTGATSLATGVIQRVLPTTMNVTLTSGAFVNGEVVSATGGSATIAAVPTTQSLDSVWLHEEGVDRVYKQEVSAIQARFETNNFQWMSGGPADAGQSSAGPDVQVRVTKVEPDFVMAGTMTLKVAGRAYAQSEPVVSEPFEFDQSTPFITPNEQRREMTLIFESNEIGGDFQMGRVFVSAEPGDACG